jgi:hypothetical protein
MGEMRKDSILERFMIISSGNGKVVDSKKSPYSPGNEAMTNPSVLSLVARDGMLQRLQDSEDSYVKGWIIRVFESKNPAVSITTENIPEGFFDVNLFTSLPPCGLAIPLPSSKVSLVTVVCVQTAFLFWIGFPPPTTCP